jgi:hypothetical protein
MAAFIGVSLIAERCRLAQARELVAHELPHFRSGFIIVTCSAAQGA